MPGENPGRPDLFADRRSAVFDRDANEPAPSRHGTITVNSFVGQLRRAGRVAAGGMPKRSAGMLLRRPASWSRGCNVDRRDALHHSSFVGQVEPCDTCRRCFAPCGRSRSSTCHTRVNPSTNPATSGRSPERRRTGSRRHRPLRWQLGIRSCSLVRRASRCAPRP